MLTSKSKYVDRRFANVDWEKTREVINQNTDAINLALAKFLEQHSEIGGQYFAPASLSDRQCFGLLCLYYKHTAVTDKRNRVVGKVTGVSILANLTEQEMQTLAIFAGSLEQLDQRLMISLDFDQSYVNKYALGYAAKGAMVYKIGLKELPRP